MDGKKLLKMKKGANSSDGVGTSRGKLREILNYFEIIDLTSY
jgi:hypothetical protein